MATKTQKMNFEASMARLEEIVSAMEEGSGNLEESLKLYEEGIRLIRSCTDLLERAEQSVQKLQMREDGQITTVPFAPDEED